MRLKRGTILGFLVVILVVPIFYVVSPALNTVPGQAREYQYSTASESEINVNAILATLAQSMNATQLVHLQNKLRPLTQLRGAVSLPLSSDDPLLEYLQTMEEFSNNMTLIAANLDDAHHSLASGDRLRAQADLAQLEELRSETKPLLRSLNRTLIRVADSYEIDTSVQQSKLNGLNSLFVDYSHQIDLLKAELRTQQSLTPTILTLNTTRTNVFLTEEFAVYGYLKAENGSALVGRNVTLSWGTNVTVERTDTTGSFNTNIYYPAGAAVGPVRVQAAFEPEGHDALTYLASQVSTQILLEYYPSLISAEVAPSTAKPTETVTVSGNLRTLEGVPLSGRLVTVSLDKSAVGNSTTADNGQFSFQFAVPAIMGNGTHFLDIRYNETKDIFAPANVTLPLVVELAQTQVQFNLDRMSILSGTALTVNGSVIFNNGTISNRGNVTVFLDNETYSIHAINGSFRIVIQSSMGLGLGTHSIKVVFTPSDPWVQSSSAVRPVYVYNTPVIAILIVAVPIVSVLAVYSVRRRRARAVTVLSRPAQPLPLEKPLLKDQFTPKNLVSEVNQELDPGSRVRRSFRLAQALINRKLGEPSSESETHWEYYNRVSAQIPEIKDTFKRLLELFELVEYGPEPAEIADSRQATEILLELREQIEAAD